MESIWSYLGYDATVETTNTDNETDNTDDDAANPTVRDIEVDTDIRKIKIMERLVRAKLDRDDYHAKRCAIRKIQSVVRSRRAVKLLDELKQHRHYNRKLLAKEPSEGDQFEEQYQRKLRKLIKARARCFQDIRNIDAFLEREETPQ